MIAIVILVILLIMLTPKVGGAIEEMLKRQTAKMIILRWGPIVKETVMYYEVEPSRVYAHIAQESLGRPFAVRDDRTGRSYFGRNLDDLYARVNLWIAEGSSIDRISYGLMQIVPLRKAGYALNDFNARFRHGYTITDIIESQHINVEVGVGYLFFLHEELGDWLKASRRYNGSLTNPATKRYLERVQAWKLIFDELLTKGLT